MALYALECNDLTALDLKVLRLQLLTLCQVNRIHISDNSSRCCFSTNLSISTKWIITSLPEVFWEEGHAAALSHTYAVKSPLVKMARPKFAPKSTPSRGPIPKPHYLPHPWTRPTYDAKRRPDPIRHFATMHWTDRPTDRSRESLMTIRCISVRLWAHSII